MPDHYQKCCRCGGEAVDYEFCRSDYCPKCCERYCDHDREDFLDALEKDD